MKDHHLRAWQALVDTGSIRAAARCLHLSQAAVTKAIRELEQDLGAPLIVRSSRGVTVTECGRQLTVRVRLAQKQLALARQDIVQAVGGANARVSVAVTPMVFLGSLPPVLERFRERMPLAEVTVEEGLMPSALTALREGAIDFAVVAIATGNIGGEYEFEPLQTLETIVACRRGNSFEKSTSWADLLAGTWALNLAPASQHSHLLDHLQQQGLPLPTRIVRTSSFGVSWNLMTRSDALLPCPAGMLSVEPYSRHASRVPLLLALPPLQLGILKLREAPLSVAAELLADLFREEIPIPQHRQAPARERVNFRRNVT